MKKLFILTLSVFFMSTPFQGINASVILTADISQSDFNDAFNTERIWYTEMKPGGAGTTGLDSEFVLGGSGTPYYEGNTSINDKASNPFEISVSSTNFLSVTFNGVGTPGGSQYGITEAFNTVWVGVQFFVNNGFSDETLDVTSHDFESGATTATLPSILQTVEPAWTAFKFYLDDKTTNIGEMTISGDIIPDMHFGGSTDDDWTYTVFTTNDTSIIPEPSSLALLLSALAFALIAFRKRHW